MGERISLAAQVDGLGTLGVASAAQLLDGDLGARARVVREEGCERELRVPLPGTPLDAAEAHAAVAAGTRPRVGAPRGAGTGWLRVRRWRRAPLVALVAARFTHPRSTSLAERTWNLLCHLRACGVGTPEPLAVGARGDGPVARDSVLVTRELSGFVSLGAWLAATAGPEHAAERRRGVQAIGALVAGLLRSAVWLPRLGSEDLRVRPERPAAAACDGGLPRRNAWPGVVLADVGGGRLLARPLDPERAATMLAGAARGVRDELGWRALARLLALALPGRAQRARRRAIWRAASAAR